jgi:hypothetical protein
MHDIPQARECGRKRDREILNDSTVNGCRPFHRLTIPLILILGLTPQTLCFRLLSRLSEDFLDKAGTKLTEHFPLKFIRASNFICLLEHPQEKPLKRLLNSGLAVCITGLKPRCE